MSNTPKHHSNDLIWQLETGNWSLATSNCFQGKPEAGADNTPQAHRLRRGKLLSRAPQGRGKTDQHCTDEHHGRLFSETMRLNGERKRTQIPRHDVGLMPKLEFKRCATQIGLGTATRYPFFLLKAVSSLLLRYES